MLRIKILRYKKSYDFKAFPEKEDGFQNNWKNNSLDDLILLNNGEEIFKAKCQTVANYCFGEMFRAGDVAFGASVSEGEFTIKTFVPPRKFNGEIHAIIKTKTVDGGVIDRNAMQTTKDGFQNGRWLIHNKYSFKLGKDTNYAWSAGCFILSSKDLERFNSVLKKYGVKAGDEISGYLTEV